MNLPTNVATGMVVGQFIVGVVDGADAFDYPDAIPAVGTVTFTPSIPYAADVTATPNPVTILQTSIVAVLDDEGYLCTPVEGTLEPAYRGVRLISTEDEDLSVVGWTWTATYKFEPVNGTTLSIPSHSFAVPKFAGGAVPAVDLATLVKVPSSTGIGTEQIIALAAAAQASATAAAASAAEAAAAATVTDAGVAGLVNSDTSETSVAIAARVTDAGADKIDVTEKGAPSGVAPLGVDSRVPDANLPARLTAAQLAAAYLGAGSVVPDANLPARTSAATPNTTVTRNSGGDSSFRRVTLTEPPTNPMETTNKSFVEGLLSPKLDASTAAATYTALEEINNRKLTFDQFPVELTDWTRINSTVQNQHSIIRATGDVLYSVFWGSDMNPYVARMKPGENTWQTFNLGTLPGNPLMAPAPIDEHNQLAMMIDGAGYLHISGNHHKAPLNYIRSAVPNEITSGWVAPGMIGTNETEVTYPTFERTNDGSLLFLYRDGTSGDGDHILNKYDTTTKTWTRVGMILNGRNGMPDGTSDKSVYGSRLVHDDLSGRVHYWWVWRDSTGLPGNIDLHYMYSTDKGATWKNAAGTTLTMPLKPSDTAAAVFVGGSGHAVTGSCVDTAGNAYATVRMGAPSNELRLYKRAGSVFSYTVLGPDTMGHTAIVPTPDGKVHAIYCEGNVGYLKQVAPTIEPSVRLVPWAMPNWLPNVAKMTPGTYTLRVLINPVRLKPGGTFGGVLTLDLTTENIAALSAGKLVLPKPVAPPVMIDPLRHGHNTYPMAQQQFYGPSGARGNTPNSIANNTFRGHIITAARGGIITECSANITTAGAAGAKGRFVIYRIDGKVLAQSGDFAADTVGLKSMPISARVGKNEMLVIGVLHHSSTGISAVYTGLSGAHDSRVAINSAASYFSTARSGYALSAVPVPAVDQTVGFLKTPVGSTVGSGDNVPIVVIKTGILMDDWDLGTASE